MNNYYSLLFSIKFLIDGNETTDFRIWPILNTSKKIRKHRMILKYRESRLLSVAELIGGEKANARPTFPFRTTTCFDFAFQVTKKPVLEKLPLFQNPNGPFIGRGPKIYLSNLNDSNQINDLDTRLSRADAVSVQDIGSVLGNKFNIRLPDSVTSMSFTHLDPDTTDDITLDTSNQQKIKIELKSGVYQVMQQGSSSSSQKIIVGDELLMTNFLGLVKIFKDRNVDYTTPIRYEINFSTS